MGDAITTASARATASSRLGRASAPNSAHTASSRSRSGSNAPTQRQPGRVRARRTWWRPRCPTPTTATERGGRSLMWRRVRGPSGCGKSVLVAPPSWWSLSSLREAFCFAPRATAESLGRRIECRPPTRLRMRPSRASRGGAPRCFLRCAQDQRHPTAGRPLGARTLRRHRPSPAGRIWLPTPLGRLSSCCTRSASPVLSASAVPPTGGRGAFQSAPRVKRLLLRRPRGPSARLAAGRRWLRPSGFMRGRRTARDPAARRAAGSRPQELRAAASGGEQGPNAASPEGLTKGLHAVDEEPRPQRPGRSLPAGLDGLAQ